MSTMTRRAGLAAFGLGTVAAGIAAWTRKTSSHADGRDPLRPRTDPVDSARPRMDPRERLQRYHLPNVALVTHDGKPVRFYEDLVKDRKVVINFMYTTCADGVYAPGNRGIWLKVKCLFREEFVVVGWTDPEGRRPYLGALLLASTVIHYIDRQTMNVLAPFPKAEYHWTNSDFALIIIAFRSSYAVVKLIGSFTSWSSPQTPASSNRCATCSAIERARASRTSSATFCVG